MISYYADRIYREPILFFFSITQDILNSKQQNHNQSPCNRRQRLFGSEYLRNGISKYCVPANEDCKENDNDYKRRVKFFQIQNGIFPSFKFSGVSSSPGMLCPPAHAGPSFLFGDGKTVRGQIKGPFGIGENNFSWL
jgi:hypothetical protein